MAHILRIVLRMRISRALTRNVLPRGAKALIGDVMDANAALSPDGGANAKFSVEDVVGALSIFCGGLVMAIDDTMPIAAEQVHRRTLPPLPRDSRPFRGALPFPRFAPAANTSRYRVRRGAAPVRGF